MKKIISLLAATLIFINVSGQNADKKWALGLFGGKTEYKGDLGNGLFKYQPFYGLGGILLNRYLSPSFDFGIQGETGDYGFMNPGVNSFLARKTDVSLLLRYKFNNGYILKEDALIAPYLATGLGLAGFSGDRTNPGELDAFIPVGGGIKINVSPTVALQVQTLYNFTNMDNRDLVEGGRNDRFLAHTLGIIFSFGAPKDSDGDMIPDKLDKCPETPEGVKVGLNGCPLDGDNDGVADYLDKCPNVAGIPGFSGCPDSDSDGIQDSEDKCPNVKGLAALNGCPDKDGDGVSDADDKCPDAKGLSSMNGCPDGDGDGIIDSEDRCPDARGTKELRGCPDTDKDGIANIDDKCPDVAGIPENKGCPAVKEEVKKVFDQALTGILFETGKDVIRSSSYAILDNIVKIMNENPAYNLEINGHTDAVGDDAKNFDLSTRRAGAVKKYLADRGIDAGRMTAKGYGETQPVADNNTAAGRTKNRRVEFRVIF